MTSGTCDTRVLIIEVLLLGANLIYKMKVHVVAINIFFYSVYNFTGFCGYNSLFTGAVYMLAALYKMLIVMVIV